MNQQKKVVRVAKVAEVKITKKGVDAALAAGNTHAKFMNKGVQKRLMKNQEKIRRAQGLQENQAKRRQKVVQKNQAVLQKVAQSAGVLDQGAAALNALTGGKAFDIETNMVDSAAVDAKAAAALATLLDPTNNHTKEVINSLEGEDPDGDDIDPASLGDDLIDVDHDPQNFGVQHTRDESEDKDALGDSGENTRFMRQAMVDSRDVAKRIAADMEPNELLNPFSGVYEPSRKSMFSDHGQEVAGQAAATPDLPAESLVEKHNPETGRTHFGLSGLLDQVEESMKTRPESFTDLPPVKVQNSSISGTFLSPDDAAGITHRPLKDIVTFSTAHREDHVFDPLLAPSQAEVGSYVTTPKAEPTGSNVLPLSKLSEDDPDFHQKRRDLLDLHARNRVAGGNTEGIYVKPSEEEVKEDSSKL